MTPARPNEFAPSKITQKAATAARERTIGFFDKNAWPSTTTPTKQTAQCHTPPKPPRASSYKRYTDGSKESAPKRPGNFNHSQEWELNAATRSTSEDPTANRNAINAKEIAKEPTHHAAIRHARSNGTRKPTNNAHSASAPKTTYCNWERASARR